MKLNNGFLSKIIYFNINRDENKVIFSKKSPLKKYEAKQMITKLTSIKKEYYNLQVYCD